LLTFHFTIAMNTGNPVNPCRRILSPLLITFFLSCGHPGANTSAPALAAVKADSPKAGVTDSPKSAFATSPKPVVTDSPHSHLHPDSAAIDAPLSFVDSLANLNDTVISNSEAFWRTLKKAVAHHDTALILRMIYYPFFDNGAANHYNDFGNWIPDQFWQIDIRSEPYFEGQQGVGGDDSHGKEFSVLCDSSFLIVIKDGMIYFGKFDGSYKLFRILNPG
jgi:hypothetical protein